MTSLSTQKTKLVTNFIIIPAPSAVSNLPKPTQVTFKQEESPSSPQEKGNEPKLPEHMPSSLSIKRKRYPKDDYQKNITINVVKCCIREIISVRYRGLMKKRCERSGVTMEALFKMCSPVLKEVVISLGDLKKMLTTKRDEDDRKLKSIFLWFLEWYLRNRYMYYLLNEGKMNHKERYIEYKNKYMLYLLRLIKQQRQCNQLEDQHPEPYGHQQFGRIKEAKVKDQDKIEEK